MYRFKDKNQRRKQDIIWGTTALGGVFVVGTLWYTLVEKWPLIDAAYMTMITLTTVGFGEIYPLSEESRLFTMGLILMGVFIIGYIVNRFSGLLIEGYFQERIRMRQEQRLIDTLKEHYIICGYGRMARHVAIEFEAEGIAFILIDFDEGRIEEAKDRGYIAIQGDATLDDVLHRAKIEDAICLVSALPSDAENLYAIISAKTLNPNIRTIARASNEEAVKKLKRAGADEVISPYITGGKRIAAAALRPGVVDFVDGILSGTDRSFYMEELRLDPKVCTFIGKTLKDAHLRSHSGALVLAIRREDGELIPGPTGETELKAQDLLICMGTPEQLRLLNQLLDPIRTKSLRFPRK